MAQIDRSYVGLALALLIVGEALGFYMGMMNDMKWRSVHIGIVLIGFVTLAMYGMLFRLWPDMKKGTLAKAQFWVTAIGVLGLVVGGIMQTLNGSIALLAASSAVMIVGTLMLAWLFWDRAAA